MSRLARVATIFLIVCVAVADLAFFAVNCWENRLYIADGPWAVAQYAEPFRSALVVAAVVGMSFVVWRACTGGGTRLLRAAAAAAACVASFALCLEAGMGVFYHPITGDFYVTAFPLTRGALRLPSTEDGVCVRAELNGFYTWHLNGIAVHPRLLPLPLDARELKERLNQPVPSGCK